MQGTKTKQNSPLCYTELSTVNGLPSASVPDLPTCLGGSRLADRIAEKDT